MYLEVSLLDTALGMMGYVAQNYWFTGKLPQPMGTGHPAMAPYQAFRASDGSLMIGVGNEAQWRRFCPAAGLDALRDDPDFATNADRVKHRTRIVDLVQLRIETQPIAYWLDAMRAASVPCSPIHTLDQALAHEQVATRDLIVTSEHPVVGTVRNMGLPVRFRGAPRQAVRTPPLLGQHTNEILREAGFTPDEIAALQASGAIAVGRAR